MSGVSNDWVVLICDSRNHEPVGHMGRFLQWESAQFFLQKLQFGQFFIASSDSKICIGQVNTMIWQRFENSLNNTSLLILS